jgi:cytochrome b561
LDGCKARVDAAVRHFGMSDIMGMMASPLRFLVDVFVNTFGITPPTPANEVRAGRVIAMMLVAVLVLLAVVGWALRSVFLR